MGSQKPGKTKGLIPGIIAGGAVFGLYTLLIHAFGGSLGLISGIIGGLLALGAGAVVKIMASGLDTTTHNRQDREKAADPLAAVLPETGDNAADALLTEGSSLLRELRQEADKLSEGELKTNLAELESVCLSLLQAVAEKPARATRIRKFVSYYLPTVLKLVRNGSDMSEKGLKAGEEQQRIVQSVAVVTDGCRKLLEKLYQDQVIDMSAEMDVLEKMLRRDGLSESELDAAEQEALQASALDTRLEQVRASKVQNAATCREEVEAQVRQAADSAQSHVSSVPVMGGGSYCAATQAVEKK